MSAARQLLSYPTVKETSLYKKLPNDKVKCGICERGCIISPEKRGFCGTKMNIDGKLYTIVFGDISALESRPIEIKPFFHFWPNSTALTFSTWSCNFRCPWCQNYHISRNKPQVNKANFISPEKLVDLAASHGDKGLCGSFTEPTLLFDYSCSVFKLSKKRNLYNCFVSNGYLTLEALQLLKNNGMDAIKIDVKGDDSVYKNYCGNVDVNIIWRNAREAKKMGLHVEIVNLVITDVNDSIDCIQAIIDHHLKELGADTPLHFTRYYPAYEFNNPPTKIEVLERAYNTAKKNGVFYPYLGNVPGHKYENTYCPNCSTLLIKRLSYEVVDYRIKKNKKCPNCGLEIVIVGEYIV